MALLQSRDGQYPLVLELKEVAEMANPLEQVNRVFDELESLIDELIRESPSPAPPGTPAKRSRSPAGCTICASRARLCFRSCATASGLMQCVAVKAALPEDVFETIKNLTQESSIIVTGKVRAEQRAPGGFEMDVEGIEVVQRVPEADPYPITPKEHGIDFLMDHRHLWLRSQKQHAVLKVRAEVIQRGARLFRRPRLHAGGYARSSPRRPAKARRRFSRWTTSRTIRRT